MTDYLYKLDPSPLKYPCPSCGQKRFVRYINSLSGSLMPSEFGRCDRVQSCGYHQIPNSGSTAYYVNFDICFDYSPKAYEITTGTRRRFIPKSAVLQLDQKGAYVKAAFLKSNNSKIPFNQADMKFFDGDGGSVAAPQPAYKPASVSFISANTMLSSLSKPNSLINFLLARFDKELVLNAVSKYKIGSTDKRQTIFWQIDNQQNVRSGKVMAYGTDGHRIKNCHPNWMHSLLKLSDFNLQQCLFGLHLLPDAKSSKVCIVESEKTALIASICFPHLLWLATGGIANLQPEKLKPLRDKQIILFPDLGAFTKWSEIAKQLQAKGFNIEVSPFLEENASKKEWEMGLDLADYLIANGAQNENNENSEAQNKHLLFELTSDLHAMNVDWFRDLQKFPEDYRIEDGNTTIPIRQFIRNQVTNIKNNQYALSYDKLCQLQRNLLTSNSL